MLKINSEQYLKLFGNEGGKPVTRRKQSKYKSKSQITKDGFFQSKKELERWEYLVGQNLLGKISQLERQVRYPFRHNDILIATYIADFRYKNNRTGEIIVEDMKSEMTVKLSEFRIKARMMKAFYDIDIFICMKKANQFYTTPFSEL